MIFPDIRVPLEWVIVLLCITALLVFVIAYFRALRRWNRTLRRRSQAVVKGLVNEQLAPLVRQFPGDPSDARFLGKPVDYIVFHGLSQGYIDEILFVEVKSRKGIALTPNERLVRDAVKKGRIRWTVYTLPSESGRDVRE